MTPRVTARLAPLVTLAAFWAGCIPVPRAPKNLDVAAKTFRPPAGKARVYVYREHAGGRGTTMIDGLVIGEVEHGAYLFEDVEPGSHVVSVEWHVGGRAALQLNAAPDTVYFFRYWQPRIPFRWPRLSQVSDADGRKGVLARQLAPVD